MALANSPEAHPSARKGDASALVREALWSAVPWHRFEALQSGGKPPHSKAFGPFSEQNRGSELPASSHWHVAQLPQHPI